MAVDDLGAKRVPAQLPAERVEPGPIPRQRGSEDSGTADVPETPDDHILAWSE
jgi:hypothetical protein